MLGHGPPLGGVDFEPDFCAGGAVLPGVGFAGGVVVVVVVDCVPVVSLVLVPWVLVDADAPAMPAAAPPVARAPATMVAPSSLEMVIGSNLLGSIGGCGHRWRRD
jgi:hypothetical protein